MIILSIGIKINQKKYQVKLIENNSKSKTLLDLSSMNYTSVSIWI